MTLAAATLVVLACALGGLMMGAAWGADERLGVVAILWLVMVVCGAMLIFRRVR
jgi:hypothetical protein